MPNLSPTCQKIKTQLDSLKGEKKDLQADLQEAAPGGKSALVKQIKALDPKINAKQKELDECVKKHPYTPPAPPKPNPCLNLKKELDKLEAALRKEIQQAVAPLQADLHEAPPGQKSAIVKQIKEAREEVQKNSPTAKKIAAQKKAYNDCLTANGGKLELQATFKGQATLTTSNSDAPGPFKQGVNIGLRFSAWDHRQVSITSFPPITVGPYDTPVGDVKTTVSFIGGGGTFSPETNSITLTLSLFFHHSTDFAGDSRLDITLNTTSAITASGKIKVQGASEFKDGFLDGDTCWLTVDGTVSPRP